MQIKRFAASLGVSAALFLASTVGASAGVALINWSVQGPGNTANVYAGNFDGTLPAGASWSGPGPDTNPLVVPPPTNASGIYQSPFNNTPLTNQTYFSVGGVDSNDDGANSPVTLSFSTPQSVFQILWGSIDTYNTIEFFDGGSSILALTGQDLIDFFLELDGTGPNFELVALLEFDFSDLEQTFDSIQFTSTSAAFEFALAQSVPAPAAGLLLLTGLALMGAAARRRRS